MDDEGQAWVISQLRELAQRIEDGLVECQDIEHTHVLVDVTPDGAKAVERALTGEERVTVVVVDPSIRFRKVS